MAKRLVVTGNYRSAFLSTDGGTTWTASTLPGNNTDAWTINGSGERIVAVRVYDTVGAATSRMFATSEDGVTWVEGTLPASGITGASFGQLRWNGHLFFLPVQSTVGDVDLTDAYYTSPDGLVWTLRAPPSPVRGLYFAVGGTSGTDVLAVARNGVSFLSTVADAGVFTGVTACPVEPTNQPVWHLTKWFVDGSSGSYASSDNLSAAWTTTVAPWGSTRRLLCSGKTPDNVYRRLYSVAGFSGAPTSYYGSTTGASWTNYTSAMSSYADPRYWRAADSDDIRATYVGDGCIVSRPHTHATGAFPLFSAPIPQSNPTLPQAQCVYHSVAYIDPRVVSGSIGDTVTVGTALVGASPVNAEIASSVTATSAVSAGAVVDGATFDALVLLDSVSRTFTAEAAIGGSVRISTSAGVQNPAVQYAVNIVTGALTEYRGFDFISMAGVSRGLFAAKPDGVYRVRQGDDDGDTFDIFIDFGESDFATRAAKAVEAVYLGMDTDGAVCVRLTADGREDYYRVIMRQPTPRALARKGLTAREWGVAVIVEAATDFNLDSIELLVGSTGRRWISRS